VSSFRAISLKANFDSARRPQGVSDLFRNKASIGVETEIGTGNDLFQTIKLGGEYSRTHNNLKSPPSQVAADVSIDNGFSAHVLTDGMLKRGLIRSAVSFDRGLPTGSAPAYNLAGVLVGYGKEIPIPLTKNYRRRLVVDGNECIAPFAEDPVRNEQTFGLEAIAGAGRAWGFVPEYARFFGGNQFTNFLYDDEPLTAQPLLRSFGMHQAGVLASGGGQRGGTSYWHANFSLSIPIPAWSRPVIPHDWVTTKLIASDDAEHKTRSIPVGDRVCVDLREVVKNSVSVSGAQLLIAQLAREKLTDPEKRALRMEGLPNLTPVQQSELNAAKAKYQGYKNDVSPEVKYLFRREIVPVTDFIADHANFFAFKPLLMFDAARIMLADSLNDQTRYGVGGGIQLDVVMVRFELGYMAALNRIPGDNRGNIVARLIMKRFF